MSFQNSENVDIRYATLNSVANQHNHTTFVLCSAPVNTPYNLIESTASPNGPLIPCRAMNNIFSLMDLLASTIKTLRTSQVATNYPEYITQLGSLLRILELVPSNLALPQNKDTVNAVDHLTAQCLSIVKEIHDWALIKHRPQTNSKTEHARWRTELSCYGTAINTLLSLSMSVVVAAPFLFKPLIVPRFV
jgi:hypothetical protein